MPGDDPSLSIIGRVCFRGRNELFGIRTEDRLRHLAVLGKTGMGKTTLLRSLVTSDIEAGRGIAVIDPHGDFAEDILKAIPSHRTNDVVLFDAGDRQHPLAFNPLVCPNRDERALRASGIVSAFRKLYSASWGPRLEHIFRFSILALIETPGTSLASVTPLLTDARYRQDLVGRLKDPIVRNFFSGEFQSWNDRYRTEAVAPILNKTGQMTANPILRGILAQPKSKLDLRRIMDDGKILIVNLSKGRVGEDGSSLLGSLLVTCLQQAAMGRASIPEFDRRDFFLYIDEFQNLSTESFATILSEARKYHLGLILANQYLDQIDAPTRSAVFGNVGSLLCFNLGSTDADTIAEQLGPDLFPRDLMSLPKYTAYTRLLINGQPTRPFSMQTIPTNSQRVGFHQSQIPAVEHYVMQPKRVLIEADVARP